MNSPDRYDAASLVEAQFEPGSQGRVLKNKLGIKRKREMDEAERLALKAATDKLLGMFDEDHRFATDDIRAMHKVWLGDIEERIYSCGPGRNGKRLYAHGKDI